MTKKTNGDDALLKNALEKIKEKGGHIYDDQTKQFTSF